MLAKCVVFALVLVAVNCRYLYSDGQSPYQFAEDRNNILYDDTEDILSEHTFESVHPAVYKRVTRQLHGVASTNPDGSYNLNAKLPLAGNDKNVLSAIGSVNGLKPGGNYGAAGAGLALDNVNGHGLSVMRTHTPNFDQLTGAGKVNLINTDNHNLNANAFITRTMPHNPAIPNFNTQGGSLDYMFKNKVGGSLGMAHTDLFKKTDYSAMGNLNLYRNPSTSLDLNAGFSKSISPYMPNSGWQPSAGLTFSKYW